MIKNIENPQDLKHSFKEFQDVTKDFTDKQKGDLALKTLITVCRCLEKVEWKIEVEADSLVQLTSQLCNEILSLSGAEYKKYVAVICNVHRCVVKKKCTITQSIELLKCIFEKPKLKLSSDQSKNYFIMLVDAFQALDREKQINKFIKIISKMVLQYLQVIDTLVADNFLWLAKRYDTILSNVDPGNLNTIYKSFFISLINNKELGKSASQNESYSIFKKLLYVMALAHDNIIKCGYDQKDTMDLFFKLCFHIFQSNQMICKIFQDIIGVFPVFTTLVEKMNFNVGQLLSNFIYKLFSLRDSKQSQVLEEICLIFKKILCSSLSTWLAVSNEIWQQYVTVDLQINVLHLINAMIKVLSTSQLQSVQCLNCNFKSGIHDSLSLSYFGSMFCVKSIKCNMDVKGLFQHIEGILIEQTRSLKILHINGCPNWKIFWKKMENSQHNDSITLYSKKCYEHSHKMFQMYIFNFINVLSWSADDSDLGYIAKGFYNMAICQSDLKLYYPALISCYISLALNNVIKDGNTRDMPHYQLIIQIKAKVHPQVQSTTTTIVEKPGDMLTDGKSNEEMQYLNVWNACRHFLADKRNSVFYKIFSNLKFEKVLLCELETFLQLWPSTNSVAGICGALQEMSHLSNSFCKPFTASPDNIGILDSTDIAITCGKAATLIVKNSVKLNNTKITDFIIASSKLLESFSQQTNKQSKSTLTFMKLLWANTLFGHGLSVMYEKRKLGAQNSLVEVTPSAPLAPHHPNIHPDDMCDVAPAHQYLNLHVEDEIMGIMYKAVGVWKQVVTEIGSSTTSKLETECMKTYASLTCDIIEFCCQVFALHNNEYSILAADIAYSLSTITHNMVCTFRSFGYLVESASICTTALDEAILKINKIVYDIFSRDDMQPEDATLIDSSLEYLLSLSIYYHNIGSFHQAAVILSSVSNRIFHLYIDGEPKEGRKLDDIKITYVKMLKAQSHFISKCQNKTIKNNMFSILTCHVNANIDCGDIVKSYEHNRGRCAILSQRMWLDSGSTAGQVALSLGLVRRARALLRAPLSAAQRLLLPRRAAHLLTLLAFADLVAERHDDCMVKIDGIKYILREQNNPRSKKNVAVPETISKKHIQEEKSIQLMTSNENHLRNFEMILDVPVEKLSNHSMGGSPTFKPTPFVMPAFTSHVRSCQCYKCNSVYLFILYINFFQLQAQLQFRNGEGKIAQSFYEGGIKFIKYLYAKLDYIKEKYIGVLVNHFGQQVLNEFNHVEMVNAENHFLTDAVIYYITEDEIDTALKFNAQVLEAVKNHQCSDYFLTHAAEEHRLFMLQSNVFKKYSSTLSQLDIMDELQSDISSKLIITPEKTKPVGSFLTPHDKQLPAVNRIRRNFGNKSPSSTMKQIPTEFAHPAIKLRLEEADDDTSEGSTVKSNKNIIEHIEQRTPAPKLRKVKAALVFDDPPTPRNRIQKLSTPNDENNVPNSGTTRIKKPTSSTEGAAITLFFGNKSHPKVYVNKAARDTMKVTLSPNNLRIETHTPNDSELKKSNASDKLKSFTKENELKPVGTKVNVVKSNVNKEIKSTASGSGTRTRAQKTDDSRGNKTPTVVATRYSTRRRE